MEQTGSFSLLIIKCKKRGMTERQGYWTRRSKNLNIWEALSLDGRENENHNHRKLTKWTTVLSNSMNYEPRHVGPPKTDGSWWRVLTKCGPLEKGMANHFSILALRTPWTVQKGKKIGHWTRNSPVSSMLLEKNREITSERTKPQWKQCPVVDVTGDGI